MTLREFQNLIDRAFGAKDAGRGVAPTFMWFAEEVGELARAIKNGDPDNMQEEFSDCLAWLTTLASLCDIDLEAAATKRYGTGCPKCRTTPCSCSENNRFVQTP